MTRPSNTRKSKSRNVSSENANLSKNMKKKKTTTRLMIREGGVSQVVTQKLVTEMRKLQLTVEDLIPKMSFCRLVKEIMQQHGQYRIQGQALQGLQAAAETYMIQCFEDGNKCTMHAKRATMRPPDLHLTMSLRSRYDPIALDTFK